MEAAVYLLGTLVALTCGFLLARGYRHSGHRLLLWSSVCFFGLSLNNLLTFIDLSVLGTDIDLHQVRHVVTAISMLALIYGLVWDSE